MSKIKTLLTTSLCVAASVAIVMAVYFLLNGINIVKRYDDDYKMFSNMTQGTINPEFKWIECSKNDTQCVGIIVSNDSIGFFCYSQVNKSETNMTAYQLTLQCMEYIIPHNNTKCYGNSTTCYDEKYVMFVNKMHRQGLTYIVLSSIFIVCTLCSIAIFVVYKAFIPQNKPSALNKKSHSINSPMTETVYPMYG